MRLGLGKGRKHSFFSYGSLPGRFWHRPWEEKFSVVLWPPSLSELGAKAIEGTDGIPGRLEDSGFFLVFSAGLGCICGIRVERGEVRDQSRPTSPWVGPAKGCFSGFWLAILHVSCGFRHPGVCCEIAFRRRYWAVASGEK